VFGYNGIIVTHSLGGLPFGSLGPFRFGFSVGIQSFVGITVGLDWVLIRSHDTIGLLVRIAF
jgi:hypothetical protein